MNIYLHRHGSKLRIHDQLRTKRASSKFRPRKVEIVLLLEPMIRKLVASRHPDAVRQSIPANHVNARNFGFLAAVLGIRWNVEWLPVRAQRSPGTLVEPLWRDANLSGSGATSLLAPMKHLHAVGHLLAARSMHRLAVPRTPQMSKSSPRDHAARGFIVMV